MEPKQMSSNTFRQTNAFAMNYALPYGMCWIVGMLCFVNSLEHTMLSLVFLSGVRLNACNGLFAALQISRQRLRRRDVVWQRLSVLNTFVFLRSPFAFGGMLRLFSVL